MYVVYINQSRTEIKIPRSMNRTGGISFSGKTLNVTGYAGGASCIGLPAMHLLLATRKRVSP